MPATEGVINYQPPELLPPNQAALDAGPRRVIRRRSFCSCEQPRRKIASLIAPPSIPSLLSPQTSALVVASDPAFLAETRRTLEGIGVRVATVDTVTDALGALEQDIAMHGCITFDQIICEIFLADDEGGEALINELRSTSWPASVVLVTPEAPTSESLSRYARQGARAVVKKPVHQLELGRLFTYLKRKPHESLWKLGRLEGEPCAHGQKSAERCRRCVAASASADWDRPVVQTTPLHITAMGVGMVIFLHVHSGKQSAGDKPSFSDAGAFECECLPGIEGVTPEWIYRFLVIVMVNLQLDEELLVHTVVLLERALRMANLVLTETNWQPVLLAAVIVATKAFYDESVWLNDFVSRLRMYPLSCRFLHQIEMAFLRAIRFSVIVRASTHYRYASEIISLHDNYCPYRKSMTCELAYRLSVRAASRRRDDKEPQVRLGLSALSIS